VSIVRLPPSVHGDGDHAFVPILINLAREKGISAYVGTGANRWPAVHRLDAARLFRLALERGPIGACYHGVAEEGLPFRDIAEAIGRRLNLPAISLDADNAAGHFSWFAHFASMNVMASSQRTRALLGWEPSHPGLIAELDGLAYFKP
jgi:nucleoside-diphosphate-sugar epimerase